ncbi:hypothetical protein OH786_36475 (plasmid) [Streptomyces atratus]|uniref:hypothetical protein n=1 Tax=Streptomyces atratus TaxID=1893 RepID=UPI002F90BE89
MRLPAEAVATTVLIEAVKISALPTERGAPCPGRTADRWEHAPTDSTTPGR